MFVNINNIDDLYFSSCDNCIQNCCSAPLVSLAPLVLDDFLYVYKKFAIVFGYIDEELRALFIINDGSSSCRYLKELRCSIYDTRPPICKMFPISPYYDSFFVNTSCKAVGNSGEWLCGNGRYNETFYHPRVDEFVSKLDKTREFLHTIKDELTLATTICGIELYTYSGLLDNEYISMHKHSKVHL